MGFVLVDAAVETVQPVDPFAEYDFFTSLDDAAEAAEDHHYMGGWMIHTECFDEDGVERPVFAGTGATLPDLTHSLVLCGDEQKAKPMLARLTRQNLSQV